MVLVLSEGFLREGFEGRVAGGLLANSNCWQFHSNERIAEPCKAWPAFVTGVGVVKVV